MKTRTVRGITVLAAAGATAFAAPALASAEPIDFQPIPIGCPAGVGVVDTETAVAEEDAAPAGIEYEIEQEGSGGGQINWVNLRTLQLGGGVLPDAAEGDEPAIALQTGDGLVVSAVWGAHQNSDGQGCFLLPGVDLTNVPAAPAPDDNGDGEGDDVPA
ncbi:hypothetical protein SAMN02745947_03273 [Rhodococcus rhodochrous J3]|jgi:hypothetical protein|uniref:Secreted protein n=2 Tax=Rhodococcus rhodochrous TaxID=1829 RepID=A0AA46X007_RHORH|nr:MULTISPECIES: hypothetical protein [Rhodococcus]AYA25867.1 hypothetical protein C6369_016220 [Rhodococcus rhodochrous]MBF4478549.1 hypothetical protein [Rhodococcus rhodochrous]MCB8912295.1 hypothetical protein [Rhodococcus rhodochrous]MDC3728397.1 hypothetical protein [Rhodococcus sp. Rp3]MDJ0400360.1 hypothetical protein [Rhodococcus rhodochrous]